MSEFGDALGGRNHASLEIHLEAVIERTWMSKSCELRDTLRGCNRENLEAVIVRVQRYTWRLCTGDLRDALGGRDRARLEEYLEAVNLPAAVQEGGATGAETLFIG